MKDIVTYIKESKWGDIKQNKYDDPIKNAVWNYVAGYTSGVNNSLRSGKTKSVKDVTDDLDKAFVKKQKIDVYRTVEWDYLKNIYGITKDNIEDKVGSILINKGYMSTAMEMISPWSSKWTDKELILHIVSDFDYPCIDINKEFTDDNEIDCSEQKELLLPRNTKVKFNSYKTISSEKTHKDGNYLLELEIVKD